MTDDFEWVETWDDLDWMIHNSLQESIHSDLGNNDIETEENS